MPGDEKAPPQGRVITLDGLTKELAYLEYG